MTNWFDVALAKVLVAKEGCQQYYETGNDTGLSMLLKGKKLRRLKHNLIQCYLCS